MTEKANPSVNRPAEAFKTAGALAYAGSTEGYVVPSATPTENSIQDAGIIEGDLNAFAQTSDGTSTDVVVDGGEAFVYGSWLAKDTDTTVNLATNSTETIYVGWNKGGTDDVIVGTDAAFANASGDRDQKIELFTVTTDGTGVTAVEDNRTIGKTVDGSISYRSTSQTADYLTSGEGIVFVDTSTTAITVTLSDRDTKNGNEVIIVDISGTANTNPITIQTESAQTIDGETSTNIISDYGAKRVVSDASNWYTAGGGGGSGGIGTQLYTRNPRY